MSLFDNSTVQSPVAGKKSTIIKAPVAVSLEEKHLKPLHMNDLLHEAKEALSAARDEAKKIVAGAKEQANNIRQAARDEGQKAGFEQGQQEGRNAGRTEAFEAANREFAEQQKSLIETYKETISSINADRAAWQASARQDLIDLAIAIARRVAHHVGQRERDVVLANLEEAVQLVASRSEVTISVNPADAESAKLFAKTLVDMQEQWEHVRVIEESEVSPGGCRVSWGNGAADATLETQLHSIELALRADAAKTSDKATDS